MFHVTLHYTGDPDPYASVGVANRAVTENPYQIVAIRGIFIGVLGG